MRLHNSLTKKVDTLRPLQQTITIYSCGPTVYDHAHIGNLSSFIFNDTIRRALQASGNQVLHVMNYTDVDDKTIRRSQETYPKLDAYSALNKLTSECIDLFDRDMLAVGNELSDIRRIKATDERSMQAMRELIKDLYQKGYAYIADDGVYFSIEAYRKSGKTYGQLLEISNASTAASRIDNDEYDKESAHDFVLWKAAKPNEPTWDLTLNETTIAGRPGWHIECSAMSKLLLGQPFDIHTGGVDLLFPHHENEIAQSTAGVNETTYAQMFVHSEHLLVDGRKMSKSLNNFYTLADITEKGFSPLAFRMLVLQSHYQHQMNFTWDSLEAAQNRLQAWVDTLSEKNQYSHGSEDTKIELVKSRILSALLDNVATPEVLAIVDDELPKIPSSEADILADFLDAVLGLQLQSQTAEAPKEVLAILEERLIARQAGNYAQSDQLRESLRQNGFKVRDTKDGQVYSRLVQS